MVVLCLRLSLEEPRDLVYDVAWLVKSKIQCSKKAWFRPLSARSAPQEDVCVFNLLDYPSEEVTTAHLDST